MLKRLAAASLATTFALAALWPVSASRFEPVTSAQIAAGLPSCAGSGAVGTTLQVTGTNTVGCAASTPGTGALRYDTSQSLTTGQQDQVRVNVGGAVSSAPSASTTLATSDIERPLFPTGAITLTVPNGGAGWRTGTIRNANTVTGSVTLAVPSGATLDGVTNGTTVLLPFQRARIVQTGSAAYITDWIDRTPVVAQIAASAVASVDANLPVGYTKFRIELSQATVSSNGTYLVARVSDNGTTGLKTGASDYQSNRLLGAGTGSTVSNTQATDSVSYVVPFIGNTNNLKALGSFELSPASNSVSLVGTATWFDNNGNQTLAVISSAYTGITSGSIGTVNLIRFLVSTGTLSMNATITGVP